jgi:hypothetical protein
MGVCTRALLPTLIGPFARLELALDVDLRALLQEALGDVGYRLVEHHDAMPFGAFLAFAGRLVAPGLAGGQRELAILLPACVSWTSGSLPRLPTRMTLLTEPAMSPSLSLLTRRRHLARAVSVLWCAAPGNRTAERDRCAVIPVAGLL